MLIWPKPFDSDTQSLSSLVTVPCAKTDSGGVGGGGGGAKGRPVKSPSFWPCLISLSPSFGLKSPSF